MVYKRSEKETGEKTKRLISVTSLDMRATSSYQCLYDSWITDSLEGDKVAGGSYTNAAWQIFEGVCALQIVSTCSITLEDPASGCPGCKAGLFVLSASARIHHFVSPCICRDFLWSRHAQVYQRQRCYVMLAELVFLMLLCSNDCSSLIPLCLTS